MSAPVVAHAALRVNPTPRAKRHSPMGARPRKQGAARVCLDSCGGPHEPLWARQGNSTNRVLRGGAWNNNANNARCAARNNNGPSNANNNYGFRCVRRIRERVRALQAERARTSSRASGAFSFDTRSATATGLTINAPASISGGVAITLSATATFSSGPPEDVSDRATWRVTGGPANTRTLNATAAAIGGVPPFSNVQWRWRGSDLNSTSLHLIESVGGPLGAGQLDVTVTDANGKIGSAFTILSLNKAPVLGQPIQTTTTLKNEPGTLYHSDGLTGVNLRDERKAAGLLVIAHGLIDRVELPSVGNPCGGWMVRMAQAIETKLTGTVDGPLATSHRGFGRSGDVAFRRRACDDPREHAHAASSARQYSARDCRAAVHPARSQQIVRWAFQPVRSSITGWKSRITLNAGDTRTHRLHSRPAASWKNINHSSRACSGSASVADSVWR